MRDIPRSANSDRSRDGGGTLALMSQEELEQLKKVASLLRGLTPEDISAAELLALKGTVLQLKRDADDCIPIARTPFNALCLMFIPLFVSATIVASLSIDGGAKYELFSYVLPIFAGWMAGAGIYNRKMTRLCFVVSVLLLIVGFFCYLQSKHWLADTLADYIGFMAFGGALVMAVLTPTKSKPPTRLSIGIWSLIAIFCLMAAGYWCWFLFIHNANYVCTFLMHGFPGCS